MFVQRSNANIGDTEKSKVGILLVGHGQPDEWDVEWPTETEQELSFRYDVMDLVGSGWLSKRKSKPGLDVIQRAKASGKG